MDLKFYFQLTKEEYDNLKFHFGTSSWSDYGGVRKLPFVFTEHGITMLAGILKSNTAIKMSLQIVDVFIAMKNYINGSLLEQKYFNELTIKNTEDIKLLK